MEECIVDTTVFSFPDEFVSFLPECSFPEACSWSAFARVVAEGGTWSETGLRRRIHRELSAAQSRRLGKRRRQCDPSADKGACGRASAESDTPPFSDDPAGLMRSYISAMKRSRYADSYSRELTGLAVHSPFVLKGWWVNHQIHCTHCRGFGDWEYVLAHNQENPCYVADLLACLHHGFLLPLAEEPASRVLGNYESLDLAPEAVMREWDKMAANNVVVPQGEALAIMEARGIRPEVNRFPVCAAPLLSVVKDSDTHAALAELSFFLSFFRYDPLLNPSPRLSDTASTAP